LPENDDKKFKYCFNPNKVSIISVIFPINSFEKILYYCKKEVFGAGHHKDSDISAISG